MPDASCAATSIVHPVVVDTPSTSRYPTLAMSTTPLAPKTTLNIIWIAMLSSLGLYWVVKVLVSARADISAQDASLLVVPLVIISTLMYGMAWWWFHAQTDRISQRLTPTAAAQLAPEQRRVLVPQLQAAVIVCMAMLEGPVILGLVNALLHNPQPLFECALTATVIGLLWLRFSGFPKVYGLLDRLESASPASH